ncbi:MAG: FMN-binding protein [Oscillospiraceae bacterium]|nr:FMN-binding protein [Oscillospiraceae bacterium]
MSSWNKIYKPIVVLSVICIVITGALAVTNDITKPIIEEATRVAQEKARQELLPDAAGFTQVEGISVAGVSDVYKADNDVGVVVTSSAKGYGGTMTVMVGFNADGTIRQIKVTEQAETKGIGSKVAGDASFWTRYEGLEAKPLVLGEDVDGLSGATISSKALTAAVNSAIEAYNAIG